MPHREINSILFDTSFLLNESDDVDRIIKIVRKDGISCYISPTVRSELDDLYYTGRISKMRYKKALVRCKKAGVRHIETDRNYLHKSMTDECTVSMNLEHGVEPKDVRNDCRILSSGLYHRMDLILSEDFHFTSKYTASVVHTVCDRTCDVYHKFCRCHILLLNKDTFLGAYQQHKIDLDAVASMTRDIG